MLSKTWFGNTEAAIYLSDQLNKMDQKQREKHISKIASTGQEIRQFVKEIKVAYLSKNISRSLTLLALDKLKSRVHYSAQCFRNSGSDPLTIKLMENVLIGELRTLEDSL